MRARRTLSAGTVGLAALAGSILWAVPAQACSCAPKDMDYELAAGNALAIVTRTDTGPRGTPVGKFRVLESVGPKLPKTLEGRMDTGGGCMTYVAPGSLAALIYERKDGAWDLGWCADVEFGKAVQRAQGDPVATQGGPAVAYAAGSFGSSRLVALDRVGNAVAWDRTPGEGQLVAVCPGEETMVSVGRTPSKVERVVRQQGERIEEPVTALTVHDATSLQVLRTVDLERSRYGYSALTCGDRDGERVQILDRSGSHGPELLTVRGNKIERVDVGPVSAVQPVDGGFLVLDDNGTDGALLGLVRPDGRRTTVAQLPDLGLAGSLAVSPDGRTAAAFGSPSEGRGTLVTVDADSGKLLGTLARTKPDVTGLAWTASGELLLRESRDSLDPLPVLVFDRTLTEKNRWPSVAGAPAGMFTTIGDSAVVYGHGSRPTATPRDGEPVVAESLRLAATEHLVAVDGAEFGDAEPSDASSDEVALADEPDKRSLDAGMLTALGGGATAAGVAAAFVVGRRRNQA